MKPASRRRKELLYLTGKALEGILADHQHHAGFEGLICQQATTEWAVRYAFETWYRFNETFKRSQKEKIKFPEKVKAYATNPRAYTPDLDQPRPQASTHTMRGIRDWVENTTSIISTLPMGSPKAVKPKRSTIQKTV